MEVIPHPRPAPGPVINPPYAEQDRTGLPLCVPRYRPQERPIPVWDGTPLTTDDVTHIMVAALYDGLSRKARARVLRSLERRARLDAKVAAVLRSLRKELS